MRIGKRSIASAERHVGFVEPAEGERMRKEEAKLVNKLRARVQGKYSYGSVKDKLDRLLQEQEITRQNQIGMFGTETPKEKEIGPGKRISVGLRAENQLKSLMDNVGKNFAGHSDEPLKFFPDFRMYMCSL